MCRGRINLTFSNGREARHCQVQLVSTKFRHPGRVLYHLSTPSDEYDFHFKLLAETQSRFLLNTVSDNGDIFMLL